MIKHVHDLAGLDRDRGPGVLGAAQALLGDWTMLADSRDDDPVALFRQLGLEHLLPPAQAADKDTRPHQAPDVVIDLTRESVGPRGIHDRGVAQLDGTPPG